MPRGARPAAQTRLSFTKVEGTGNDFLLVDLIKHRLSLSWKKLAPALCDRKFGVGADGLLLVSPSKRADLKMRIVNADGTEAEMCGNGIRCVARHYYARHRRKTRLEIETKAGLKKTRIHDDGTVSVNMGRPVLDPEQIPVVHPGSREGRPFTVSVPGRKITLVPVSMGNPHALVLTPLPDKTFFQIAPFIEKHPAFPNRTNVHLLRVKSPSLLEILIWERGAGATLSCGTGACAALVGARVLGQSGPKARVRVPGGTLAVEWRGEEVTLTGPARFVFEGRLVLP